MLSRALVSLLLVLVAVSARAEDPWLSLGGDGQVQVELYFFSALTCPHCAEAQPHIEALARERPWLRLHTLELTRHPEHVERFRALARQAGGEARSVPALIFCGEIHTGWGSDATTGAVIRQGVDACHARARGESRANPTPPPAATIAVPLVGDVDPNHLSLPVLTAVLAGLDAFNPCAFFVLLFLLSMLAHQRDTRRMLLIGGVFVTISGLMYFAFMAAWLNVFQVVGHLGWVTFAAGALALFVGLVNIKDFFQFQRGLTLSIPETKKPEIFRRTRLILAAERIPAMLGATVLLAIAANFYELLCTAGFPMVYTRALTLADLSAAERYGYLAAYNLIYILPLALIVAAFARTLGARKLTDREGRLLKLLSGVMMLALGVVLLVAPERISRIDVAVTLLVFAITVTWLAARLTRKP
ncbi:MAG: hypothetical protein ACFCUG_11005 [Thiotrichales bacterium]